MFADDLIDHIKAHRVDGVGDRFGFEQLVALLIHHLPLVIGDVIKLQQLFADVEVAPFHLALSLFDSVVHHTVLDRFALLHTQGLHEAPNAV